MRTKILYSYSEISGRIDELAKEINEHYSGEPLLCVCVLKGAFMFFSELVRRISGDVIVDFITLSSYHGSTAGELELVGDIRESVLGRHVLIVEDIVDSGGTVDFLLRRFKGENALSVKVACLIDKPLMRKFDVSPDFAAFTLETPSFVVGFGLDYDQRYRCLDSIMEVCLDE